MGTNLRTGLSKSNPFYISKHRRLELTHFCLQYPEWENYLTNIKLAGICNEWSDPTSDEAIKRFIFASQMKLVEDCCLIAAPDIYKYMLIAVTKGKSFANLSTMYDMPCGRDYFYERYHKFFYILSQKKHMF